MHPEPLASIDVDRHNAEAAELWAAHAAGTNDRVPVTLAFDEQFLLPLSGVSFREYYTSAETQLRVQLRSQEWIARNVLQDRPLGVPDEWWVAPAGWMEENEFLGARVVVQEDDYAWALPLDMSKTALIEHLRGLDVEERVRATEHYRLHQELLRLAEGASHLDRPVRVVQTPVGSTHGIFTKAAEIRGLEQLCMDLVDDPPFVRELLAAMVDLTVERVRCWRRLTGAESGLPSAGGWGCCDDSLTMLSREHYEGFVLPEHERLYRAFTTGPRSLHLCGRVQHLFGTLQRELGIGHFDGPGTQVDLVRMVRELKAPFGLSAQVSHGILASGEGAIEAAVRQVLADEVKRGTRMSLLGYAPRGTPLASLRFFYACARRHAAIER